MAEPIQGREFVWLRSSTSTEAVSLLVSRFPLVLDLGDSERELVDFGAFYTYGLFAAEIVRRGEEDLLRRVAEFINHLATSKDSFLEELARDELLQTIAAVPEVDQRVSQYLGSEALQMRQQIS
jgi:hypothetical protein